MTVVSAYEAERVYDKANSTEAFRFWGAAQDITRQTAPLVRGTQSLGGGLIPARNYYMFGAR